MSSRSNRTVESRRAFKNYNKIPILSSSLIRLLFSTSRATTTDWLTPSPSSVALDDTTNNKFSELAAHPVDINDAAAAAPNTELVRLDKQLKVEFETLGEHIKKVRARLDPDDDDDDDDDPADYDTDGTANAASYYENPEAADRVDAGGMHSDRDVIIDTGFGAASSGELLRRYHRELVGGGVCTTAADTVRDGAEAAAGVAGDHWQLPAEQSRTGGPLQSSSPRRRRRRQRPRRQRLVVDDDQVAEDDVNEHFNRVTLTLTTFVPKKIRNTTYYF